MNYFEVFGLPRHLRIDVSALEKAFYAQSRKLHPDRFASRPAAEQEAALGESSRLNDAYRTLKDPVQRTQYLLSIEGIELEEQSKAATEAARVSGTAKKQLIPPELLEEVFELNMQLMELKAAKEMGDSNDPAAEDELKRASAQFEARLAETGRELEHLQTRWDAAEDAGNAKEADATKAALVALLNRRSYLRNLLRDVTSVLGKW